MDDGQPRSSRGPNLLSDWNQKRFHSQKTIPPAILGFGDIFGIAPPHHLKLADWAAISEIALAVFAFAALVGAIIQIRTARTSSRVEITYNYTERFSNLARDHLASFYELAHLPGASSEERLGAFLDWESKAQYDALTVPNFYRQWERC
jgi:hypothetical protein